MTRAVSIFMVALASLAVQRVYAQPPAAPVAGQAQPVAVRGTEMAGATQFRARCETCHGKIARAPSLGMLRRMAPERIYQALTTGAMQTEAQEAKLTDPELRDIAAWMGGRKLEGESDDAMKMPNRCSRSEEHTSELQSP